jgi:hypothetical protein
MPPMNREPLLPAVFGRAMEAQQWARKAMRSADRVAGPCRESATRKPDALKVKLVGPLFAAVLI